MYAGGTSCPDRVHGYSYNTPVGNYKIDPMCPRGRMTGYIARFENVKGKSKYPGLHQTVHRGGPGALETFFRSPASAASAANGHCLRVGQGLAGVRGRKRRKAR